jgi:Zn-dependent protease
MNNRYRPGSILRVRLRFHGSWIIAFILLIVVVYTQFPEAYSMWNRLLLGVIAGSLFTVTIVLRQLALSFLTLRRNIPLRKVTLYVFGGVPGISKENTTPLLEILLGTAGLLFTLLAAGIFYVAYAILVVSGDVIMGGLVSWLSFIFILMLFVHIIPGFPLDGGRILRAVIWRATGDYDRGTAIAAWIGRGVGLLFIAGGLAIMFVNQQWSVGAVLVFIGWLLYDATTHTLSMVSLRSFLRNTLVSAVMIKEFPQASQQVTMEKIIREKLNDILVAGQGHLFMVDDGQLRGSVDISNIKSVPKKLWKSKLAADVMTPANVIETARLNQNAADLFEQMTELGVDHILVMDGDKVVGRCDRQTLARIGKIKGELAI